MEGLIEEIDGDEELWRSGEGRRATLDADAGRVRATLVWVMREFGAV